MFKAGQGAGKSGSFFFSSYDNRFIIKTLTTKEKDILLSILDDMILHLVKTDNKSLLARIYGLYTLRTNVFGELHIMIMQFTCMPEDRGNERLTFDLKGSSVKRLVKFPSEEDQQFWRHTHHCKRVLKDTNFQVIANDLEYDLIQMHEQQIDELHTILKRDAAFLASKNIMDYSLLLVIEKLNSYDDDRISQIMTPSAVSPMDEERSKRNKIFSLRRPVSNSRTKTLSKKSSRKQT